VNKAIVTPFNVFSALSFLLLASVALLVHSGGVGRFPLAAASAFFGFLLIIMFLSWTVLSERSEA
jgi:hypothetical protein